MNHPLIGNTCDSLGPLKFDWFIDNLVIDLDYDQQWISILDSRGNRDFFSLIIAMNIALRFEDHVSFSILITKLILGFDIKPRFRDCGIALISKCIQTFKFQHWSSILILTMCLKSYVLNHEFELCDHLKHTLIYSCLCHNLWTLKFHHKVFINCS